MARPSFISIVILAMTGTVRADLSVATVRTEALAGTRTSTEFQCYGAGTDPNPSGLDTTCTSAGRGVHSGLPSSGGSCAYLLTDSVCPVEGAWSFYTTESAVHELPALPGSASLFLSAIVSMGAWHFVRRARNIQLGDLPDWYHPDAPKQIGHAVVFDLDFVPLAICRFECSDGEKWRPPHWWAADASVVVRSQGMLKPVIPRAPPASA